VQLAGNVLSVSQHFENHHELAQMVEAIYFALPLLLNVPFADPPYVGVDGSTPLFVIGGSLAPVVGTVCLRRRDSHADQGAVATQFSSSTGTGTSPRGISPSIAEVLEGEMTKIDERGGVALFARCQLARNQGGFRDPSHASRDTGRR
jgi:hypothetical protein